MANLLDGERVLPRAVRAVRPRAATRPDLIALAVVAVAYFAAQAVVVPPKMFLGWDEAIYVSQIAKDVPAAYMSAPRAYGVPLLVGPLVAVTDSMIALRLYLGALSALGLFLAFLPWLRIRPGATVPLAALLFGALWVPLFYAGQAMPNMVTAFCAVAAVGLFLRLVDEPRGGGRGRLAGLAASLALMALMRPSDTVWVAGPLVAAALVRREWRDVRALAAMVLGCVAGVLPWLIEAQVRFGGIAARLHQIDEINNVGWRFALPRQLIVFTRSMTYCPHRDPDCGALVPGPSLVWVAIPILAALGLWSARRAGVLAPLALAAVVGAVFAAPYFFYINIGAPRFLLPSYALLALPVAEGVRRICRVHHGAWVAVAAVVTVFALSQASMAHVAAERQVKQRGRAVKVAAGLEDLGLRPGCFVHGTIATGLAVAMRCRSYGDRFLLGLKPAGIRARLTDEAARGVPVAAVAYSRPPAYVPDGWRRVRLPRTPGMYAYLPPVPAGRG